jgi:hypothetical protein
VGLTQPPIELKRDPRSQGLKKAEGGRDHLHLVSRVSIRGVIPPLPPYILMTLTGPTLTLLLFE